MRDVAWSVVELDLGLAPAPSGSGEVLIADEHTAMLVFFAWDIKTREHQCAIATFRRCSQAVFGYPNDEAWPGHRYFDVGIWTYGILEVVGSDWSERLTNQNRVAFPKSTHRPGQRHFIVACHENVAEFLAEDIEVEAVLGAFEDALTTAVRRLAPAV
jgi:hypothetical protein